jgi:hypothetical protein
MKTMAHLRQGSFRTGLLIATAFAVACAEAGRSQVPTAPTPTGVPEGWLTYADPAHGFSIGYPGSYTPLPESSASPRPGVVKRARFQDRQIATTPFADREPERFLVEVYPRPAAAGLEAWLRSAGGVPADAEVTRFSWPGAEEAVAVRLRTAQSPNEFFYFSTARWFYVLTPAADGRPMLGTFVLSH